MIYISCSAVVEDNEFVVKSVYVVGETESWIITDGNDWSPIKVFLNAERLQSILQSQRYYSAPLVFSPVRQHTDDDPKAFAVYLRNKIRNGYGTKFHKKLFKILSSVGEEWSGK